MFGTNESLCNEFNSFKQNKEDLYKKFNVKCDVVLCNLEELKSYSTSFGPLDNLNSLCMIKVRLI